jgi:hypothetical protein
VCGVLVGLLLVQVVGCELFQESGPRRVKPVNIRSTGDEEPMTPFELQSRIASFADGFAMGLSQPLADIKPKLEREAEAAVHRWVASHATVAIVLASGPNPLINLLDLTGMATLARMAMEEYWIPQVLGDVGTPLLEHHRVYENEIWKIARDVITEEQEVELRSLIDEWRKTHRIERSANFVTISDYAKERWTSPLVETGVSKSLLSLVHLDPLSKLDPTTRQLAQTRYTAERLIYFVQRLPTILRLQTEMLYEDLSMSAEFIQALGDLSAFRQTAERFVDTVDALPQKIAQAQREFLKELVTGGAQLADLSKEYGKTFSAGSDMAASVAKAIEALDAYTVRVTADPEEAEASPATVSSPPPADPDRRGFDVLDYAQTATEIARASKDLEATIASFDKLMQSPAWESRQKEVTALVAELERGAERITQQVFLRGLILIAALLVGALVVLLIYRRKA